VYVYTAVNTAYIDRICWVSGVMAFLKRIKNCNGVFLKLKVAMAFLKYAKNYSDIYLINSILIGIHTLL
jgi:hypothetical protein